MAELTYRMMGGDAMVDHTWVDPKLRGGGDAARLVEAVVEWARSEHMKLVPACSYVRAVFDRTPAYADVRKELARRGLLQLFDVELSSSGASRSSRATISPDRNRLVSWGRIVGTTCQERPYLSFSQPHCCAFSFRRPRASQ